jgi:hypothetical protein
MNKYWFIPKRFGWGFFPISWEGWVVVLITVIAIVAAGFVDGIFVEPVSVKEGLRFLLDFSVILTLSSLVSLKKTKGKVTWRWG